MNKPPRRRRIRFIKRGLQTRLIASFLGLSLISLLLQVVLIAGHLLVLSDGLAAEGGILRDAVPGMLLETLGLSVLLLLPLTALIGVWVTFRTAGPIYRVERHLEAIARGEDPGPCRLRRGDELQELCELLNRAVETLRESSPRESEGSSDLAA